MSIKKRRRVESGKVETCPACGGRGLWCNYNGMFNPTCSRCDGTGHVRISVSGKASQLPIPITCLECKHSNISATEVQCQHWHHPGRTMARDLRLQNSVMQYVAGMEWAKHCVNFKPKPESPTEGKT